MKAQFFAGVAVAVLALGGYFTYASWGAPHTNSSISQQAVTEFTEAMRAEVVAEVGQPIEGFEPFMFMRAFPALTAQDFDRVDALIGMYRYQNGELAYDLNGEQELHSAARAISDEGMAQLLFNVAERLHFNLSGNDTVQDVLRALKTSPGADPTQGSSSNGTGSSNPNEPVSSPVQGGGSTGAAGSTRPAGGSANPTTLRGEITCLPHKGDGPHTMECAFGLKADSGKYYSLRYLWEVAPGLTQTGVRIEVVGGLSAPEPGEKYDIAGNIDVDSATGI